MPSDSPIPSPDNILKANYRNIIRKLNAGKTLTKAELDIVGDGQDQPPIRRNIIQQIWWTIDHAAAEFNISPETLSKRIKNAGIEPNSEGKFSTLQICDAVFGSYDAAKTREAMANAALKEAKLALSERRLLPADFALATWSFAIGAIRQRIIQRVPEDQQDEWFDDLRNIDLDEYFKSYSSEGDLASGSGAAAQTS